MTAITDDYANSTATIGTLAIGAAVNATFAQPQDSDWFAVTLTAGTEYMFTLATATPRPNYADAWLAINDATGLPLAYSAHASSAQNPVIDFRPTGSGVYYVSADLETYGSGTAALGYTLAAALRTGADDFAPGADGAGVFTAGASYAVASGVFELAGDRDWFKFHAAAGMFYNINSTTRALADTPAATVLATSIFIVDANGEQLPSSVGGKFNALVSGDYYVDVTGMVPGKYNIYSLAFADDYAATDAGAGSVVAGASVSGLMQFDGDNDRFTVTLEANQYYTFSLAGPQQINQTLRLIGPDGASLGSVQSGYASTAFAAYAATAGDYHLVVANALLLNANGGAVPYTISASSGRPDDVGDTPGTAAPLAVGAAAHAALQGKGDIDTFKITLQAGTTYAFALKPDVDGAASISLALLDADGTVLAPGPYNVLTNATYTPSRSGDFYAAVSTASVLTASLPYTMTITTAQDDFGASVATAGKLAIGATIGGMLEAGGGDRDWFAVALTAGTTYWLTVANPASSAGAQLRLLDAGGNALTPAGATSAAAASGTVPFVLASSGTYYIEVASAGQGNGAYTLGAAIGVRDDYGITPATAGVLTPSAPATGKFELGTDTDMFKISVVAGTYYGVSAGTYLAANSISVTDSDGSRIFTSSSGGSGSVVFAATKSGDAYVTLKAWTIGSYSLTQTVYGVDDAGRNAASAGALAIGASLRAALSYPGDVDWQRVHLEGGVSYTFQLLGAAGSAATIDASRANFAIVNSYGSTLAYAVPSLGNAGEVRLAYTPASAGDYYLTIGADYTSVTGAYTIKATQLSGDVSGPTLLAQSLAPGATGVALTQKSFSFTFSEAITIDSSAITIKDAAGANIQLEYGAIQVNDGTLTLRASGNFAPGSYTVSVPHAAVHDLAGNAYTGPETFRFSTVLPVAAGTPGNDMILAASGATGLRIDGGAGIDTVVYAQSSFYYTVAHTGATLTLTDHFTGRVDTLVNVERVLYDGPSTRYSTFTAYDVDGNGGQAYRLYQAAFHRTPDQAGVGYWIAQMDQGLGLRAVAEQFVGSAEFKSLYGAAPSDNAYITALYSNVLQRAPDAAGFDYWGAAMHNGGSRADVLQQFSESAENQAALVGVIAKGFTYTLF